MLIFCLFSTCSWLVAGRGVLFFPLRWVRKCVTLPVALYYLKYQIVVINITNTIVPTTVIIIGNYLGITNRKFSSICLNTSFTI